MNGNITVLCSVILIIGLFRCVITGTALEKHFSLIYGLILLILIVKNILGYNFTPLTEEYRQITGSEDFESLVKEKAAQIIEENVCGALNLRYGYICDAEIFLYREGDTYRVQEVIIKGEEKGYIKQFVSDYLVLDEGSIEFA